MPQTSRANQARLSEAVQEGRDRPVALSHAECHRLLTNWAACELAAIRRVWYPPCSAGYQDYEPPRDPEARLEREVRRSERDDFEIARTGWCLITIARPHREALKAHYRDGNALGRVRRGLALDAFSRAWAVWSEAVDGPLNSL